MKPLTSMSTKPFTYSYTEIMTISVVYDSHSAIAGAQVMMFSKSASSEIPSC